MVDVSRLFLSRPSRRMLGVLVLAALTWGTGSDLRAELRTWTDKSGKYKIEAEFVEVKDGKVQLKKSDGTVIEVPLTKLCKDDQILLRKIAQKRREAEKSQPNEEQDSLRDELRERIRQGGSFQISREVHDEGGQYTENFSFSFGNDVDSQGSISHSQGAKEVQHGGIWTDVTGRHRIPATFVSLENDNVRLRRKDGKIIKLPISKLSTADQKRARVLASSSLSLAESRSPFGDDSLDELQTEANAKRELGEFYRGDIVEVQDFHSEWNRGVVVKVDDQRMSVLYDGESHPDTVWLRDSEKVRLVKANPNGANYSAGGTRLSKTDLSGFRTINFDQAGTGKFLPDAESISEQPTPPTFPLGLNTVVGLQSFLSMEMLGDLQQMFVAVEIDPPGIGSKESAELYFYDLKSGSIAHQHRLSKGITAAAVSPSGKRVATIEDGKGSTDSRTLSIWNMNSGVLENQASWDPHKNEFFKSIDSITWINDQRLVTTNFRDLLIWDVDSRKLLFKIVEGGRESYCLSHNRKQLIAASPTGILALDLDTGQILVNIDVKERRDYGRLALCPSGQLLAASHSLGSKIDLINLETGEVFDTLNLHSKANEHIGFFWPDDQHILIGGKDLVHVASKATVWNYQHQADKISYSNGLCWFILRGKRPGEKHLLPLKLPQSDVANVSDDQLALRPGDVVSLDIELTFDLAGGDKSIYEQTREKLTKDLEEAGFFTSEGAPAILTARTTQGETDSIQYRRFGDFHSAGEVIDVTPRIYTLELRVGEDIVWQRRQVQAPSFHVSLEKDESIQDAISRVMQPSAGYFGIGIPSRILKPSTAESRFSKVTIAGLE